MPAREYDKKRERSADRERDVSRSGREIGSIPPVKNHARKRSTIHSFQAFCESYFPLKFNLALSQDHLRVIAAVEKAVCGGGLFALAMPRGSGKTTICETAVLWALLTGRKRFPFLIGSSADHALGMLGNLKSELSNNELLLEDYPEVCYPIACLEGEARRAGGQLHHGQRTCIGWYADEIILPTIPGSPASGSLVRVAGITGNIRGALHTLSTGESIRPDLSILDDPQTEESANSLTQNEQREAIICGAVLNLAGPGKAMSALMPCTVIQPDDMVDRLLDRKKHPEWNGERCRMVYRWPDRQDLWEKYAQIRAESMVAGGEGREATEFYRENREAMDAGAEVAWEARYKPDELSALQHAVNLRLRSPTVFEAEYQNDPKVKDAGLDQLTSEEVANKLSGRPQGDIHEEGQHVTAFIDVHGDLLYWVLSAWSASFEGWVIDYGTWPEQNVRYFSKRDAKPSISEVYDGGVEATIRAALVDCVQYLFEFSLSRDDGSIMQLDQCLIDCNWSISTGLVYDVCQTSPYRGRLMPSRGKFYGAKGQPFEARKKKPGDRVGLNWCIPSLRDDSRKVRHATFDANFWKSFVAARLRVPLADRGSLSLYGSNPHEHRNFSEHCTAEYSVEMMQANGGRKVDEWTSRPDRPDNHWWDCLIGCAVAASICGAKLPEHITALAKPRLRRTLAEMKAAQGGARNS